MKFKRTESTHLVAPYNPDYFIPGVNFSVEINHSSDKPDEWLICLIDYDGATGATGIFKSEAEVMQNLDGFLVMAVDAYDKKYAKRGDMPLITLCNGSLKIEIDSSWRLREEKGEYQEGDYDYYSPDSSYPRRM